MQWHLPSPTPEEIESAIYSTLQLKICESQYRLPSGQREMVRAIESLNIESIFDGHCLQIAEDEIHLSSPAHAYAYLTWIEVTARHNWHSGSDVILKLSEGPFIFRGQRNFGWKPIPSLYRFGKQPKQDGLSEREQGENALATYEFMLSQQIDHIHHLLGELPRMDCNTAKATAQHYTLETPLLDWTADSRTAFIFACSDQELGESDEYCAVLMLPLHRAKDLGLTLTLPPMWIDRLYKQQGIFVEMEEERLHELSESSTRVIFPRHPHAAHSSILPEDNYLYQLAKWVKAKAGRLSVPTTHKECEKLQAEFGRYLDKQQGEILAAWHNSRLNVIASAFLDAGGGIDHVTRMLDLIESVGLHYDRTQGVYKLDDYVRQRVVENNPNVFAWLRESTFDMLGASEDKQYFNLRLNRILKEEA